jgi:hypothetical protein
MTDSDTAVDEDTASMLSESEFEREVCTQEDLRTASLASLSTAQHHSLTHSHAHSHTTHTSSSHRRPIAPDSTGTEGSASSSSDSSEASEGVISPMFHNRILLLVPLLYLALTRTLWWPLQASAQVLLVFVLLTLAVRLTSTSTSSSSPPQMFHMTPSEIGLKDILEQSKTLLHVTQESEGKEHSPVRLMYHRY